MKGDEPMDAKELAALLNGREYRNEMSKTEEHYCRGIVFALADVKGGAA